MSDLDQPFSQAAASAKALPKRPDDDTLLRMYALFKQGSEGDVQGDPPGFFDFVGAAKYEAWEKLRGINQDEAKQKYIDLIASLKS